LSIRSCDLVVKGIADATSNVLLGGIEHNVGAMNWCFDSDNAA
jgi:hypothetical protein